MLSIFFCVFHTLKNVLCNKSKNPSVRFFICMSSMCVQLFTAFEETVLKLYLGECHKIKDGHHFHGNEARGKIYFVFSPIFFHTDHNKCTLK